MNNFLKKYPSLKITHDSISKARFEYRVHVMGITPYLYKGMLTCTQVCLLIKMDNNNTHQILSIPNQNRIKML